MNRHLFWLGSSGESPLITEISLEFLKSLCINWVIIDSISSNILISYRCAQTGKCIRGRMSVCIRRHKRRNKTTSSDKIQILLNCTQHTCLEKGHQRIDSFHTVRIKTFHISMCAQTGKCIRGRMSICNMHPPTQAAKLKHLRTKSHLTLAVTLFLAWDFSPYKQL
jgi:hypothetical protein